MRKFYFIILLLFVLVNAQAQEVLPQDSSLIYKIIKIDTIKNINVIFAKKKEFTFKIVLFQDLLDCPINIKPGQSYKLLLKSVIFGDGPRCFLSGVRYGPVTIYLERNNGILWDLFYIQNLKDFYSISNPLNVWNSISTNVVAPKTE